MQVYVYHRIAFFALRTPLQN